MTDLKTEPKDEIQKLLDAQDWAAAAETLEEVLARKDAGDQDVLYFLDNLGYVYFRLGRPSDALECCRRALEMDVGHAYAFKGQGVCLAELGKVEEGVRSLLNAIHLDPNFFDAYHDLAVILLRAGHKEKAKPWAQRAYQLDPVRGEALVRKFY